MENSKKEKTTFILFTAVTLCFALLFLVCFIALALTRYPSPDTLSYEACTFVKYQDKNLTKSEEYSVYVEEYDEPLKIDTVVYSKVSKEALSKLEAGDTVTISLVKKNFLFLCAMSYNETSILSYEDYVAEHNATNRVGMIVTACLTLALFCPLVINLVYYIKTGRNLPKI